MPSFLILLLNPLSFLKIISLVKIFLFQLISPLFCWWLFMKSWKKTGFSPPLYPDDFFLTSYIQPFLLIPHVANLISALLKLLLRSPSTSAFVPASIQPPVSSLALGYRISLPKTLLCSLSSLLSFRNRKWSLLFTIQMYGEHLSLQLNLLRSSRGSHWC